jgi:hypothetical protein
VCLTVGVSVAWGQEVGRSVHDADEVGAVLQFVVNLFLDSHDSASE